MRGFLLLAALAAAVVPGRAAEPDYTTYAELLARYVTENGVRYAAWRGAPEDARALGDVVSRLAGTDPGALPDAERYALFINLYNAKVLEIVVTAEPVESIKDLSRGLSPYEIFKRKVMEFDGARASLDTVETRLRKESEDPRVHFAVNCASRSCPPILGEPYRGATGAHHPAASI